MLFDEEQETAQLVFLAGSQPNPILSEADAWLQTELRGV